MREDYRMSNKRRQSVEDTTAVGKRYASSGSVYFVCEVRKYWAICGGERHVSGLFLAKLAMAIAMLFARKLSFFFFWPSMLSAIFP